LIVVISAGLVLTMTTLLTRPRATDCDAEALADAPPNRIVAARVVVQPWYGLHHVYGIFVVPDRYQDSKYSETISVAGMQVRLLRDLHPKRARVSSFGGVMPPPGHYLTRAYLPTRIALRLLFTGHLADLRTSCRWALLFGQQGT